ncbi:MAG TPA: endonuclease VII domain-containing protein [Acidimicrobiia bacterium]|nr:endonuclease VII domain-containing protein [Acidimicrobiia bacterium]
MRRNGISAAEVDELLRKQCRVCAICGREDPEHVDHDHKTGKVRGILCFNCNGGLGRFSDNMERLPNAVEYLEDGVEARIAAPPLAATAVDRALVLRKVA